MGAPWELLGALWDLHGSSLGTLWELLGAPWVPLGAPWQRWVLLRASWGFLGSSWGLLVTSKVAKKKEVAKQHVKKGVRFSCVFWKRQTHSPVVARHISKNAKSLGFD